MDRTLQNRRARRGVCIALVVWGLVALGATGASARAAKQQPLFTAQSLSRYLDGSDLDDPERVEHALDATGLVPVQVTVLAAEACRPSAHWRVDHAKAWPEFNKHDGCRFEVSLRPTARPHWIEARVGKHITRLRFVLEDRFIAALGDSVASGEGNPGRAPTWASPRCHRSPVAGVEQAARVLGEATGPRFDAHGPARFPSVTFVSLACSGATIPEGVLGDYAGIRHRSRDPKIPAQVKRLEDLRDRRGRTPDAVLVSVGANDVHFGDIVRHCIAHPACPSARFDPDHNGSRTTADDAVEAALGRLGGRYDELAGRLRGLAPRHRHGPPRVYITEYFDPTRNALGQTCASIIGGTISRAELEWAETSVLDPLNDEVAAAAQRNRWHEVGGIAAAFSTHGYCLRKRPGQAWVRRVEDSIANLAGPLHPTGVGQHAIAAAILPPVGRALGIAVVVPAASSGLGGDETPWLAIGIAVVLLLLALALFGTDLGRSSSERFGRRLVNLFRHGHDPAPVRAYQRPRLPRAKRGTGSSALLGIAVQAIEALAAAVVSVGFVVFVGSAIVWVRFWAARYPADQAVDVASRGELLVIGAQALVLFAVLGLVAVLLMWLLDPRGQHGRRMIVALAVLLLAELVAAVIVGEFGSGQLLALVFGFAAAAGLAVFLYDVVRRQVRFFDQPRTPLNVAKYLGGRYFPSPRDGRPSKWLLKLLVGLLITAVVVGVVVHATNIEHAKHRWLWAAVPALVVLLLVAYTIPRFTRQLVPLVVLAIALFAALHFDEAGYRLVVLSGTLAVAVVWFALPRPDPKVEGAPAAEAPAAEAPAAEAPAAEGTTAADPLPEPAWQSTLRLNMARVAVVATSAFAVALVYYPKDWLIVAGAVVAFVLASIWAIGKPVPQPEHPEDDKQHAYMNAARAAIAAILLVCLTILVARDEWWLGASALAAVALAGICLAIAWASGDRFLPFGVTVFASVCVFGGILACVRTIDSPQAQPVAILLKDRAVCGVWVGESDQRVWYARLRLADVASIRRPTPRDSGLASVSRADVQDMALGPLQTVGRAQDQAVALRSALLSENHRPPNTQPGCGPFRASSQKVEHTPERALAKSVQPELVVDRKDGFWPVSVLTLVRMQDRRARVCRRVAEGTCVRVLSQSDFSFNGGEGEWLDYPANPLHRGEERRLFRDALGSVDPARTAREYFLVTHRDGPNAPITVQFWFFYTYNYLQTAGMLKHDAGLHEGDFETVSFLLSAHTHKPRYVWMARHDDEGRMFVWQEPQLTKAGGRLVAYAARGSHADYESCRRQSRRIKAPFGLVDDRPQCKPEQELHLAPEATHIIDLSRVPWACWRGLFGEASGGRFLDRVPYETAKGPRGPLWQQKFGDVAAEPCRGVRDSDPREFHAKHGGGEEVLNDKVSAKLRRRAGVLDDAVDRCTDWEHPPSAGAFLFVCDQRRLTRYLESGLESPGAEGLRIDVAGTAPSTGPITVPAVRRDPREPAALGTWRITATRATTVEIYAACQARESIEAARFTDVRVPANEPLHVDGRDPRLWRLRMADGTEVGVPAAPTVIQPPHGKLPAPCAKSRG